MQISRSYAGSGYSTENRGRILVVDDDPGLLKLLTIRLRAERYEVEAVESAEEALSVLTRFRPDLVISDLRMANMDGIELLREIHRQRPGLCVLLLTAHGRGSKRVKRTWGVILRSPKAIEGARPGDASLRSA